MVLPLIADLEVIESQQEYDLSVEETSLEFALDCTLNIVSSSFPDYEGEYNITPSEEGQVLLTENEHTLHNIVVAPIPTNYGRISWDGSTITVW